MSDFTCTTPGIAIQLEVPSSLLSNSTNPQLKFQTTDESTTVGPFAATAATSINGNPCAQYVTTGTDFTVPGLYYVELLYLETGQTLSSSTKRPFPTIIVDARL
jgi:hypothetical protein